jgi:hypothetical protein
MNPSNLTFIFEGQRYRIIFRHDISRRLGDHLGHEVYLTRGPVNHRGPFGATYLVCETCTSKYRLDQPLKLTNLSRREKKRMTFCSIAAERDGEWMTGDFNGSATVNEDAGDIFSREEGRRHALIDALTPWVLNQHGGRRRFRRGSAEFRAVVWEAYNSRKSTAEGAGK